MSEKIRLIIDTDPGQDDAAAILMAHGLAKRGLIDFMALTVVAGNVSLHHTATNARIICDWAGEKDFPVYAGAGKPLLRSLVTAEEVHGKTGLDGVELHEPVCPLQPVHAVPYLIDTLRKADDASITICPIGPLTNIAQALSLAPDIGRAIKNIVLMGGNYFEAGNITPAAEFNFYVDPHAAQVVLQSGVPITILPLDVTHKATSVSTHKNSASKAAPCTTPAPSPMPCFPNFSAAATAMWRWKPKASSPWAPAWSIGGAPPANRPMRIG